MGSMPIHMAAAVMRMGRRRVETYGVVPTDLPGILAPVVASDLNAATEAALAARPDLAQARLQLDNAGISLTGSRNAVLPSVDPVAGMSINGMGGALSSVAALGQVFALNYPVYGVGVQGTAPVRNRIAQADVQRNQHSVRQLEKLVRVEIANALERAAGVLLAAHRVDVQQVQ
jgi:outer membrane protein